MEKIKRTDSIRDDLNEVFRAVNEIIENLVKLNFPNRGSIDVARLGSGDKKFWEDYEAALRKGDLTHETLAPPIPNSPGDVGWSKVDPPRIDVITDDPEDPRLKTGQHETGMNDVYLVLPAEERQKGFVRPFRNKYVHVGKHLPGEPRPLTGEELTRYRGMGYVAFIPNPNEGESIAGHFLIESDLKTRKGEYYGGCGVETIMGDALSETYARNPQFYGKTYCCGCRLHLPVSEFRWTMDDTIVGS